MTTILHPASVPFSPALLQTLQVPAGFAISVFAQGLGNVRWLQVAANGNVYASWPAQGDGTLSKPTQLLDDLPEGGNHPRRTLGMGTDGWLYMGVGPPATTA